MENSHKEKDNNVLIWVIGCVIITLLILLGILTFWVNNKVGKMQEELYDIKEIVAHLNPGLQDENNKGEVPGDTESVQQAPEPEMIVDKPAENAILEPDVKHKVYLTFDDGPSKQTDAILDILDAYDVKATFFVVGKEGEEAQERLRKIYEKGHTIGMHSYSHDYTQIYESQEAFREDFLKSKQYIFETIGVESRYFRFPGGSSNTLSKIHMGVFAEYLEEQGVEYYDWNISSGDGGGKLMPASVIVKNCVENIEKYDTSIILLHDSASKTTTVEALPQIIEKILEIEDTAILPLTDNSRPIHHAIKPLDKGTEQKDSEQKDSEQKETSVSIDSNDVQKEEKTEEDDKSSAEEITTKEVEEPDAKKESKEIEQETPEVTLGDTDKNDMNSSEETDGEVQP